MRVATFNIYGGRVADGSYDEALFEVAVATLDADVLALQEVDRGQARSGGADLALVAARTMTATAYRFAPALTGTPAAWRAASGDEPEGVPLYGIALLSRFPVRRWRTVRIAPAPGRIPYWSARRLTWVRDEARVAVVAEVQTPRGVVEVVATHLSFLRPWNRWQLHRLVGEIGVPEHPRLLLGDLNMGPGPARRTTGLRPLAVGKTFPAGRPREQIDHILGSPGLAATGVGHPVLLSISDHRALVAEL